MNTLRVELYEVTIGHLEGIADRFDFTISPSGIEAFGLNSSALSLAIPLQPNAPRNKAPRRRNWFDELLPEGDFRGYLAQLAGLSSFDTVSLLAAYGADVAGAVQILPADHEEPVDTPLLHVLSETEVYHYLTEPFRYPLGNTKPGGKTSLAGVQPKILLAATPEGWARVTGGAASTHILKPAQDSPSSSLYDEEYGLRLARALGLLDYSSWVETFNGLDALVIERYDRVAGRRIHQEDFSQILGASGNQKYQEFGGLVSLRRVASALQRGCSPASVDTLARLVVFSAALGNLNLHSKNISVLHPEGELPHLASAYDCVPMGHRRDHDGRLAMSIGGHYPWATLSRAHLVDELSSWGLHNPDRLIDDTLEPLAHALEQETPHRLAHPDMPDTIARAVKRLGVPGG